MRTNDNKLSRRLIDMTLSDTTDNGGNVMYITIEVEKYNDNFKVSIYRNGIVERVTSKNMKIIAEYIDNISKTSEQIPYIDNRGFGLYLTDCLDAIGSTYKTLKYRSFVF